MRFIGTESGKNILIQHENVEFLWKCLQVSENCIM